MPHDGLPRGGYPVSASELLFKIILGLFLCAVFCILALAAWHDNGGDR